jgi:hypothetical protein
MPPAKPIAGAQRRECPLVIRKLVDGFIYVGFFTHIGTMSTKIGKP